MKNLNHRISIVLFCLVAIAFHCYSQTTKMPGETRKILIVSDIHFAPLWGQSTDTALKRIMTNLPVSAWQKQFENSSFQMTLGPDLYNQDANYAVLKSAMINMKKKLAAPAFIIIAGDFIWHNATPADSVLKRKTIQFIAGLFKTNFPGVPIIPAMGNNDTYGEDYALQDPKFLNDFADAWAPNFPKSSAAEMKAQGYYTWKTGNLNLVVINSAPLSYGSAYPQQAATMLQWFQAKLSDPHHKDIWILSHIPPGLNGYNDSNMWIPDYTQTFVNYVVKYAAKIKLEIASHTHFNDFKVYYNTAQIPVTYMRIVPSICSNHGNNPSFEVAEYSAATGRVVHETNWYLNLANVPKYKSLVTLVWTDKVTLPASLNLGSISATNLSKCIDNVKNDKTNLALKNYVNFYNIGTVIDSSKTINRGNIGSYLKADSLKAN